MTKFSVLTIKHCDDLFSSRMKTTEQLANEMPELKLPRMRLTARSAYNQVLDYEMPPGNSSTRQVLELAESRGFSSHPADWIPYTRGDNQFASLYQPDVDWLSENGQTPYWEGNSLTRHSWDKFKPTSRRKAFRNLLNRDRAAVYDVMLNWNCHLPAATRLELLNEVDAGGMFYGNYPWQVTILKHYLLDKSKKVRELAATKLKRMAGLETAEDHAAELVKYFKVKDGTATSLLSPKDCITLMRNFYSTTYDVFASALGLHPHELARISTIDCLTKLMPLIASTPDVETRSIVATRLLDSNLQMDFIAPRVFKDLPLALWERGLRLTFHSNYIFAFVDFLGTEIGKMQTSLVCETKCYKQLTLTVINEVKDQKLPINKSWDPLRILGLAVNKESANDILNKAIDLGMNPNNPRLAMLRLNLAL